MRMEWDVSGSNQFYQIQYMNVSVLQSSSSYTTVRNHCGLQKKTLKTCSIWNYKSVIKYFAGNREKCENVF